MQTQNEHENLNNDGHHSTNSQNYSILQVFYSKSYLLK